jgi:hypothetical protein
MPYMQFFREALRVMCETHELPELLDRLETLVKLAREG